MGIVKKQNRHMPSALKSRGMVYGIIGSPIVAESVPVWNEFDSTMASDWSRRA